MENWTPGQWVNLIVTAMIILIFVFGSFFSVGVGEVGVLFNRINGKTSSYQQGFYFKLPVVQTVTYFDVKTQRVDVNSAGASKDLQEIKFETMINFH